MNPELLAAMAILAAIIARAWLDAGFRRSLRREAPQTYQRLAGPRMRRVFLSRAALDYLRMMLLRTYRRELAHCPASRAWASWISFVDWVLVAFVALLAIGTFRHAG